MIQDILKGKNIEQIKKDLANHEGDFQNKEFLVMVKNLYPDKFDGAIHALARVGNIDVFSFVSRLLDKDSWYSTSVKTLPGCSAMIFLIDLCGISKEKIQIAVERKVTEKKNEWKDTWDKTEVVGYSLKLEKQITVRK